MYEIEVTCEICGERMIAMSNEPTAEDMGWCHDECIEKLQGEEY